MKRSLIKRLVDMIFGYDFFVSYRWSDGYHYAQQLSHQLTDQGFECFLDAKDYAKGDNWRLIGRIALRNTSILLVVCSPEVLTSDPVVREVIYFKKTHRRIVPIDVDRTLLHAPSSHPLKQLLTDEIISIDETAPALLHGPSDNIVNQIRTSQNLIRQSTKRVRLLSITSIIFAALAILSVLGFLNAESRRMEALSRSLSAQSTIESERQIDASLLLAARANDIRQTPSSRSSLLQILERAPVDFYLHTASAVRDVEFNPMDSKQAVSVDWNGNVSLWSFDSRTSVKLPSVNNEKVWRVAVSPDGNFVAGGGSDGNLLVWNLNQVTQLPDTIALSLEGSSTELVFLDDKRVLIATDPNRMFVLNLNNASRRELSPEHTQTPSALLLNKNTHSLFTAGSDRLVIHRDLQKSELPIVQSWKVGDWILSADIDPTGKLLLLGLHDEGLSLLNIDTGDTHNLKQTRTGGRAMAVSFSEHQRH